MATASLRTGVSSPKREPLWDQAKGISMLAVICIHCCPTVGLAPGSIDLTMNLGLRQLANFAVPTFLAIAGYFDGRSNARSLGRRLVRLLPPYILWTFIFVALKEPSHLRQPFALASDLVAGTGIGIGYFVVVIVQMIIAMTLLAGVSSLVHGLVMALGMALGTAFTYANALLGAWPAIQFPYDTLSCVVWYPFYHLGFVVSRSTAFQCRLAAVPSAVLIIAVAAGVIASFAEAMMLQHMNLLLAASQLKLSSKLMSLAVVLSLFSISRRTAGKDGVLSWIGRNSYFVYLFHLLPMAVLLKMFPALNGDWPQMLSLPVVFSWTLASSLVATWLGRAVLPARVQPYVLG